MKTLRIIVVAGIVLFITSCSNNNPQEQGSAIPASIREQYLTQIKKVEEEMHSSSEINNVTGNLAIKAYTDYAGFFPDDSLSPDYLFKAGEIAIAMQQYPQALTYYNSITEKYPKFKYIQESLYLQGFLLDNYLNEDAKAKIIYEKVITKYPTSSCANDAKAAINNLGKTDEELIKEFKKKNGEK